MLGPRYAWIVRVVWAAAAFTVGPALAAALHAHHDVRTAASVALWAVWTAVLVATLVSHPVSLTVSRVVAPAVPAATVWAAVAGGPSTAMTALAALWSAGLTTLVFSPAWSLHCVNGPAYPGERRYPLAAPGGLLLGPLELSWAALIALPTIAVLGLAAHRWVLGGVAAVATIGALLLLGRAVHGLSLRWAVFVPAGFVLCDPLSVLDPVLFPRALVERLGPAPAENDALDLTQGAMGLALELALKERVPLVLLKPGSRSGETGSAVRLLFTPSRPGAVVAEAQARELPVG